jgi:hypothetical protein
MSYCTWHNRVPKDGTEVFVPLNPVWLKYIFIEYCPMEPCLIPRWMENP